MAIGFRTSNTQDITGTSPQTLTFTKPVGTVSTDILIAIVACGAGSGIGSNTPTVSSPAGWTVIFSGTTVDTGGGKLTNSAFWALGSVSSLAFTCTTIGTTTFAGGSCGAFTGVDNTVPIDATGTANTNIGSGTLTTNAVTIITDQSWHLIGGCDFNDGTFSAPSFNAINNAHVNQSCVLLYNTTPKSIGSTGTVVITTSAGGTGNGIVGLPFALRPDTGGGGGSVYSPNTLLSIQPSGLFLGVGQGLAGARMMADRKGLKWRKAA